MKPEQRKEELLHGLRRASEGNEVYIDVTQVMEVLGLEETEKLLVSLVHMEQLTKISNGRSGVLPGKDRIQGGMAGFMRDDLLAALEAHTFDKAVKPPVDFT